LGENGLVLHRAVLIWGRLRAQSSRFT
jgi:hypothetical protein